MSRIFVIGLYETPRDGNLFVVLWRYVTQSMNWEKKNPKYIYIYRIRICLMYKKEDKRAMITNELGEASAENSSPIMVNISESSSLFSINQLIL